MKVYVAAPYPAREYVQDVVGPALAAVGHESTSTWATGTREINVSTVGASPATEHDDLVRHVKGDLYDIARAQALISLTAEFCVENAEMGDHVQLHWLHTGGRHVELGYALGMNEHRRMKLIVVGEPENVFQRAFCTIVLDLASAIRALA
jgi:hypothetical protein